MLWYLSILHTVYLLLIISTLTASHELLLENHPYKEGVVYKMMVVMVKDIVVGGLAYGQLLVEDILMLVGV